MPVGETKIGGATKSELDQYQGQMDSWYTRSDGQANYKSRQMAERPWYINTFQGGTKGLAKTVEAGANLIPDLMGADQRFFTFSDYIPDNPESNNYQLSNIGVHLVSSYLLSHRAIKASGFGAEKLSKNIDWSPSLKKRWGKKPKSDKEISAMDDKTRSVYIGDLAKNLREQDRMKRSRGLTPRKLYEIGKQGIGTGVVAEGVLWRGQDEELIIDSLRSFFDEYSELEGIVEEAIEDNPNWMNEPANKLGEKITFSWNAFHGNALGRLKFAGEGAVFGLFFNYFAALLKVGAVAAGRTGSRGLSRILHGGDQAAKKGADATEAAAKGGDGPLSAKERKKLESEDLAFGGDQDTVTPINEAEAADELAEAHSKALDGSEAEEAAKPKELKDIDDESLAPREWDEDLHGEVESELVGVKEDLYKRTPVGQNEEIPVDMLDGPPPDGSIVVNFEAALSAAARLQDKLLTLDGIKAQAMLRNLGRKSPKIGDNLTARDLLGSGPLDDMTVKQAEDFLGQLDLEKEQIAALLHLRKLINVFEFTDEELTLLARRAEGSSAGWPEVARDVDVTGPEFKELAPDLVDKEVGEGALEGGLMETIHLNSPLTRFLDQVQWLVQGGRKNPEGMKKAIVDELWRMFDDALGDVPDGKAVDRLTQKARIQEIADNITKKGSKLRDMEQLSGTTDVGLMRHASDMGLSEEEATRFIESTRTTSFDELPNETVRKDPVSGEELDAWELMEKMDAERIAEGIPPWSKNDPEWSAEFSKRRGYSPEQIKATADHISQIGELLQKGHRIADLQYFEGNITGQLDNLQTLATTYDGKVVLRRSLAQDNWNRWQPDGSNPILQEHIPKDVFSDYQDFERFIIEREKAYLRNPMMRGEDIVNYHRRVQRHAINASKRKGIGDFYKYEFDPKGPAGLRLTESEQLRILFGEGNDVAGKKVIEILKNAGKARGRSVTDAMNEAAKIINIDNTMTDIGSKYLTGRIMSFFIHSLRQGFSHLPDDARAFKKADIDTLADALGFVRDPHRRGPAAILEEDVLNGIDDIADANAIGRDAMAERIRSGRGDFRKLYGELAPSTSLDKSLSQDVKVLKEAYIRTVAYKMDAVMQVKRLEQLADDIVKLSDDQWAANKGMQKAYHDEMQRIAHKVSNLQKLGTAGGRLLRAQNDMHKAVFSDMEKHLDQVKFGNPATVKKHAHRLHAIMQANKHSAVDSAIASKEFLSNSISGIDIHNEYWLNSILSGTKTQMVNFISTGIHLYYKPVEGMVGALMRRDPKQAKVMVDSLVQTAMINASVMKVLGSLGWNWAKRAGGLIDNAGYHAGRSKIFKRGQEGTGPMAQATGAVAGARKSFRAGEGTLSQHSDLFDVKPPNAISGRLLGEQADESFFGASMGAKKTLDYVGNLIRMPMRLMITSDELFKQIAFRSTAMSKLAQDALEHGLTSSDDVAKYIADNFKGLIRKNGKRHTGKAIQDEAYREHGKIMSRFNDKATDEFPEQYRNRNDFVEDYVAHHYDPNKGVLSERAMDWAEDVTYTRRLDKDAVFLKSLGKGGKGHSMLQDVQDMVHRHPYLRLVMPFIKTPVNILKFPLQRMNIPFITNQKGQLLGKEVQWLKNMHTRYAADMASGDPQRMAEAAGRVWAGRFYWVSSISLASSGVITGGGPSNPRERNNLIATGWRPYSVRMGDKYISYSRLDPFSTVLGLAADVYEKFAEQGQNGDLEEDGFQAVMLAGAFSLSNNIADKSYLAGINNVLQAFLEPETKLKTLLKKQTGAYIPKIVSQWTPLTDDHYMKKTYSLLEGLMVRTPGAARHIEPMRNYLGDPVEAMYQPTVWAAGLNPFLISKAKKDPILDEIGHLDYGFGAPTARIKGSRHLDMRKFFDENGRTAFDRFQEAIGQEKINGRTLRSSLERLFNSPGYERAGTMAESNELFHQGTFRDPRIKAVKSIMAKYRNRAKNRVLKEYPNLKSAVRTFNWQTDTQMEKLLGEF